MPSKVRVMVEVEIPGNGRYVYKGSQAMGVLRSYRKKHAQEIGPGPKELRGAPKWKIAIWIFEALQGRIKLLEIWRERKHSLAKESLYSKRCKSMGVGKMLNRKLKKGKYKRKLTYKPLEFMEPAQPRFGNAQIAARMGANGQIEYNEVPAQPPQAVAYAWAYEGIGGNQGVIGNPPAQGPDWIGINDNRPEPNDV